MWQKGRLMHCSLGWGRSKAGYLDSFQDCPPNLGALHVIMLGRLGEPLDCTVLRRVDSVCEWHSLALPARHDVGFHEHDVYFTMPAELSASHCPPKLLAGCLDSANTQDDIS